MTKAPTQMMSPMVRVRWSRKASAPRSRWPGPARPGATAGRPVDWFPPGQHYRRPEPSIRAGGGGSDVGRNGTGHSTENAARGVTTGRVTVACSQMIPPESLLRIVVQFATGDYHGAHRARGPRSLRVGSGVGQNQQRRHHRRTRCSLCGPGQSQTDGVSSPRRGVRRHRRVAAYFVTETYTSPNAPSGIEVAKSLGPPLVNGQTLRTWPCSSRRTPMRRARSTEGDPPGGNPSWPRLRTRQPVPVPAHAW